MEGLLSWALHSPLRNRGMESVISVQIMAIRKLINIFMAINDFPLIFHDRQHSLKLLVMKQWIYVLKD